MERFYPDEIVFRNDNAPYLNENNLNAMSHALANIDKRVAEGQGVVTEAVVRAESSAESANLNAWEAKTSANMAKQSEFNAKNYEGFAYTSASRANDYMTQTKQIAEGLAGTLIPMGTKAFEELPSASTATIGSMYNISNEFTTTADFEEGAGIKVPMGANVYLTANHKWDILAGSLVTGVKGDSEMTYRTGDVNITASDLALDEVATWGIYSDLAGTPTFGTNNEDSDIEIAIKSTPVQKKKEKIIGGLTWGKTYLSVIYTFSAKLKEGALNFLSKVNPKGIGKFSVGHDVLAYGEGSHAEGGYTTATGTTACTVTSIEIDDVVATIGLNFSSTITLKTLWQRPISRTTTKDVLYRSIEVKSSTGETVLTNTYSDFVVKYFLETDEQKADISNVAVDATLYLCFGGTSAIGISSHAEGSSTVTIGSYSHAEGYADVASGNCSHAEGGGTVASGIYSHAEGSSTTASASYSHSEGASTKASGYYSHAEGSVTTASGQYSHSEGNNTIASGQYSHAQNLSTLAKGEAQTTLGKYNIGDTTSALIVGMVHLRLEVMP